MPRQVVLYTTPQCTLCRDALADLDLLAAEQPLIVQVVDVSADAELAQRYLLSVPVVQIEDGPTLTPPISMRRLRAALAAL